MDDALVGRLNGAIGFSTLTRTHLVTALDLFLC